MCKIMQNKVWQCWRKFGLNRIQHLSLSRGWPRRFNYDPAIECKVWRGVGERVPVSIPRRRGKGHFLLLMNILQSPKKDQKNYHDLHVYKMFINAIPSLPIDQPVQHNI